MRLSNPQSRLARASTHKLRFAEVWNAFLEKDEPYSPFVRVEDDGRGSIYFTPSPDFPAEELSLIFGEMLYQLRAALDSLIYEVAIIDSGQDPPPNAENLEFVIRGTERAFKDVAWKIAPLSDSHREMIESIQPYHTEYANDAMRIVSEALDTVHDLARRDRHRGLHVVASWGANKDPLFDLPVGCRLEWVVPTPDGLLEHESKVADFKVSGLRPGMKFEANPNLTVDVTLDDAPPPSDDKDTLSRRAQTWIACVAVTIEGFEKTLG